MGKAIELSSFFQLPLLAIVQVQAQVQVQATSTSAATSIATIRLFPVLLYLSLLSSTVSVSVASSIDMNKSLSSLPSVFSTQIRRSLDRGHANHGWLNSFHTFSFAGYHHPKFNNFHSLRVINEDRVVGGEGFGSHPHSEFEIFSYVVNGALRHQDSLGHNEVIPRGTVQFTSAGRGLSHSEYNASPSELVHFIQMWVKPNQRGLTPSYQTKSFSDASKRNQLRVVVSPDGRDDSVQIHQDFSLYASLLGRDESVSIEHPDPAYDYYVHVIQDASGFESERNEVSVKVNGQALYGGDGMFLRRHQDHQAREDQAQAQDPTGTAVHVNDTITFQGASQGDKLVEFLVFEVKRDS